jgi:hypothetical protein
MIFLKNDIRNFIRKKNYSLLDFFKACTFLSNGHELVCFHSLYIYEPKKQA